jgi:peptidoglycan/xylan/chitin deacetylase (PgdA/CDA1 family)
MAAALKAPPVNRQQLANRVAGLDTAVDAVAETLQRTIALRKSARHRTVSDKGPSLWRQAVRRGMGLALPRRMFLTAGPQSSREISLTFDDGPHPEHTPRLLDLLHELNVKATFFVIGREAIRHPNIVRRIVDEGHTLANHTWSHTDLRSLTPVDVAEEVRRTGDLLAEFSGAPIRLFRPPLGKFTAWQMLALWKLNQTIVLWNVDPKDYACSSADALRSNVAEHTFRAGDIVLLHDNHPFAGEVLPELVSRVRSAHLDFATIDGWAGTQRAARPTPVSATHNRS